MAVAILLQVLQVSITLNISPYAMMNDIYDSGKHAQCEFPPPILYPLSVAVHIFLYAYFTFLYNSIAQWKTAFVNYQLHLKKFCYSNVIIINALFVTPI